MFFEQSLKVHLPPLNKVKVAAFWGNSRTLFSAILCCSTKFFSFCSQSASLWHRSWRVFSSESISLKCSFLSPFYQHLRVAFSANFLNCECRKATIPKSCSYKVGEIDTRRPDTCTFNSSHCWRLISVSPIYNFREVWFLNKNVIIKYFLRPEIKGALGFFEKSNSGKKHCFFNDTSISNREN